ncbi:MAG: hypothetical protein WCO28_13455 [Bacteroidota bacterium]
MRTKNIFIALALIMIISAAFINHKSQVKTEYAVLLISHFGPGSNYAKVTYENGDVEDLVKKLNLKFKAQGNTKENFPEEVKTFKFLNDNGYKLISHACNSNVTEYSYLFIKGN